MISERAAQARKKLVDSMALTLLQIDERNVRRMAVEIAKVLVESDVYPRILVCGGVGAHKTSFAQALSQEMDVPAYDFSEYVPGGFSSHRGEYHGRLTQGLDRLAAVLPRKRWIIEHVDACLLADPLQATVAVHLDPGLDHLKSMAQAREVIREDTNGKAELSVLESSYRAKTQFRALQGRVVVSHDGYAMKVLGR